MIMNVKWHTSAVVDLCFSPDENIWYFLDKDTKEVSQDFATAEAARKAWYNQQVQYSA